MDHQCQHLSPKKRERLLHILRKFESLFDETLGTWETPPVDLELKDDATPVCLRLHPVPRVHEAMLRQEVEILVKLGVLKEDSEWGAPSFDQNKPKMNRVIFLSDFRNLNRQFKT